jgi:hypothetical protein
MRINFSNISTSILLAEYRTLYFVLGTLYKKGPQNYQYLKFEGNLQENLFFTYTSEKEVEPTSISCSKTNIP